MNKPYDSPCYRTNTRWSDTALTNFYDKMLEPSGLTSQQFYMLRNLRKLEKANVTQWATFIGIDRTTMVRNAKVLEKHGLIEPCDGSGKSFCLTEKALKALELGDAGWDEAQGLVEKLLGKEDMEAFFRITDKLINI